MKEDDELIPIAIDHGFSHTKTKDDIFQTGVSVIDAPISYENVIEKALTRYAKSVFHIIRETGVNVKTTPITFVGGGAALMRRYAGIGQKNIRYIEDVRANARGYDLLLRAYLKKKGMIV